MIKISIYLLVIERVNRTRISSKVNPTKEIALKYVMGNIVFAIDEGFNALILLQKSLTNSYI